MSAVYFAIPSCRPAAEAEPIIAKWRKMGYRIALLREGDRIEADITIPTGRYLGWAPSINILARFILSHDSDAEWIVSGGDDIEPDPDLTAEQIGWQCRAYFGAGKGMPRSTFGVMQPTGDRWADGSIDRICGSPWLGREFCERMYQGTGPMFDGYKHMFGDEELQHVSAGLGILWQRRDLVHLHKHYFRTAQGGVNYGAAIPTHMIEWNGRKHWDESQALYTARKAASFPGHEPLALKLATESLQK